MLKFLVKRILWLIPVVLGVSVLIFTIMCFTPGDPARNALGADASQESIDEFNERHGLNDPYFVRLGSFLKSTFLEFDLGTSYINGSSVSEQITSRLGYTMKITYIGILISIVLGIPAGIIAATNQNTWKDSLSMVVSLFCASMPSFWFALLLVMFFALRLGWLPTVGVKSWSGYILHCVSIGIGGAAGIARQTRSSMLEVIRQDYVTTAKAKGQSYSKIIWGHCLRNALIPVLTVIGSQMAVLVGSSLVCETIFSIPGIGSYLVTGVNQRDYPVVLGCVVVLSLIFSLTMLCVDLMYAAVDPRFRNILKS